MGLVQSSLFLLRPLVWSVVAVTLIMVGLPAVLAAAT
jgi:hypothetical protein